MRKWGAFVAAGALLVGFLMPVGAVAQTTPSGGRARESLASEPAAATDQVNRYTVTFMSSITSGTISPTGTAISITNNGSATCSVSATWFRGHSTVLSCTTDYVNLPPGHTAVLCSRSLPNWVSVCDQVCNPALTFHEGRARVRSTAVLAECAKLAVDARVYYFAPGDGALAAVSHPKIVKGSNSGE